jgi:hypothetical protein
MKELRTVDVNAFECGGRQFTLHNIPSFARYSKLQELGVELMFGISMQEMLKQLTLAESYINKLDTANCAHTIIEMKRRAKKREYKDEPALRICALFVNEKGEDLADATDAMISSKIECWAKELDPTPFVNLAVQLSPFWMAAYNLSTLSSSQEEKQITKQ